MLKLDKIMSEQVNPKSVNLSNMETIDIIKLMNEEDKFVIKTINEESYMIEKVINKVVEVFNNDGRLIYIGAGSSGRLAILDASECHPTFGVSHDMVQAVMAGGDAFIKADELAEDSLTQAIEDLKKLNLNSKDIVIGVAASGRTPYVISGLNYAKSIGANISAVVCTKNSSIAKICDLTIELNPGAEILTGSTRLKSGTATKMVLNMITTISMVRLGKVYKNYMVDVVLSNEKLIARGINIVMSVTECSFEVAKGTLEKTANNVKLAITAILLNVDVETAKLSLEKANGFIDKL